MVFANAPPPPPPDQFCNINSLYGKWLHWNHCILAKFHAEHLVKLQSQMPRADSTKKTKKIILLNIDTVMLFTFCFP
jgi:hypothetical protein